MSTFCVQAQQLRLNEFVASNATTIPDEDGDYEDWLELFNAGDEPLDLLGYSLSDDDADPLQWQFPAITLEPGDFLLVFCSGKNRLWGPYLHTNFKLKQSGEPVLLTDPTGTLIDAVAPTPLGVDFSYARVHDGEGYWERYTQPTPGYSNATGEVVVFSHAPGYHNQSVQLELQNDAGLTIRYTTNGSSPSAGSPQYTTPIELTSDNTPQPTLYEAQTSPYGIPASETPFAAHVIRAQGFIADVPVTPIFTRTFFIGDEVLNRYAGYPVVSLTTDPSHLLDYENGIYVPGVHFDPANPVWTGNYFQRGIDWERDVHIEFFEEGSLEWSQNAGLRIHGGKTRNQPQKSFRLYARGVHGANKFHHKIFDTRDKTVFDRLMLRAHFACWNKTMIKDQLSAYVVRELDFDTQHARPAIVLLNGEYWGIQTFRDRYDRSFFSEQYDIKKDSVDILLHGSGTNPNWGDDWGIVAGDNADYLAMHHFIENNPLEEPENYAYVKTKLDVNSMIEFYCTAVYLSQYDWPSNNHKVWRGRGVTKWRWMMYDFDAAWGYRPNSFNTLNHASHPTGSSIYNTPYTTFLFRELLTSEEFRQSFLHTYACLMNSVFLPENLEAAIDHFVDMYADAVPEHLLRWNNLSSIGNWHGRINLKLRDFAEERREHAIAHVNTIFGIDFDPNEYDCEGFFDEEEDPEVDPDDDDETVHVNEQTMDHTLKVYPNPAQNGFWVDADNLAPGTMLAVYNFAGQQVYSSTYRYHTFVELGDLPAGVYLVMLVNQSERKSARIIMK